MSIYEILNIDITDRLKYYFDIKDFAAAVNIDIDSIIFERYGKSFDEYVISICGINENKYYEIKEGYYGKNDRQYFINTNYLGFWSITITILVFIIIWFFTS